jgi:hypothetical protein
MRRRREGEREVRGRYGKNKQMAREGKQVSHVVREGG